jgi:hypothetical protein
VVISCFQSSRRKRWWGDLKEKKFKVKLTKYKYR